MNRTVLLVAALVGALSFTSAHANQKPFPIVKNGSCPAGYYSSGGYCVPAKGTTKQAIPKVGNGSCPAGYVTNGNYCR